jgi:hypothetical protein
VLPTLSDQYLTQGWIFTESITPGKTSTNSYCKYMCSI